MSDNSNDITDQLSDGTLVRRDGTVAAFGTQRFLDDIVNRDGCFLCGSDVEQASDEHVLPRWLQKRCNLFTGRQLTLPNGEFADYGKKTLPCCRECNAALGVELEEPVSRAFGRAGLIHNLRQGRVTDLQVFSWLSSIYVKMHLRDRGHRESLDRRRGEQRISDRYYWPALHHAHCVTRGLVAGVQISPEVLGSTWLLPMCTDGGEAFDYVDLYPQMVIMLRVGDLGIISVLDDSCMLIDAMRALFERIQEPLTEIQLRELTARVAHGSRNLKERPEYMTVREPGTRHIAMVARLPNRVDFLPSIETASNLGEVMHFLLAPRCKLLHPDTPPATIDADLMSGRWSSLAA